MDELCEHCGKPSAMLAYTEQVTTSDDTLELRPAKDKPQFYCSTCQEVCYCSAECMAKDLESHADFCVSPRLVNWRDLGKMIGVGAEKKIPCIGEPPNAVVPIIFIPGPISVLDPTLPSNHWRPRGGLGKARPEAIPKAFRLIASDPQANDAYNLHVNSTLGGQLFYYVVKYKDFPRAVMRQLSPRQQEEIGEISKNRSRAITRDKLKAAGAPQMYERSMPLSQPSHATRSKLAKDKKQQATAAAVAASTTTPMPATVVIASAVQTEATITSEIQTKDLETSTTLK